MIEVILMLITLLRGLETTTKNKREAESKDEVVSPHEYMKTRLF